MVRVVTNKKGKVSPAIKFEKKTNNLSLFLDVISVVIETLSKVSKGIYSIFIVINMAAG